MLVTKHFSPINFLHLKADANKLDFLDAQTIALHYCVSRKDWCGVGL